MQDNLNLCILCMFKDTSLLDAAHILISIVKDCLKRSAENVINKTSVVYNIQTLTANGYS